jgi:two-component system response regulator PhoP
MRALVVEDEELLRKDLSRSLRDRGFAVDEAADGSEGVFLGKEYPIDIAVIDLGLPKISGIEVIKQLRKAKRTFPILILTARSQWQDKVEGLEAGADDYLVKPFHVEEFIARIYALLRRAGGWMESTLVAGPVSLNITSQEVLLDGQLVDLTAYEYRVLQYLMLHPRKIVSKMELTEHIYEQDFDRDSNVIEVFVARLRKKLDPESKHNLIETLRGRGYRFTVEPTKR